MKRGFPPAVVKQLRQYREEGRDLAYIAQALDKTPGAVVGYLNVMVRKDSSWRPFANRCTREYTSLLKQRPPDASESAAMIQYITQFPRASTTELQEAGFGPTLQSYPGGLAQAREDAENAKDLAALSRYTDFVDIMTAEACEVRKDAFSFWGADLIRAVFDGFPYFDSTATECGRYVRDCMQDIYPVDGSQDLHAHVLSGLKVIFEREVQELSPEKLRILTDEAMETLDPREKKIIELRFLGKKRYTLEEISAKPELLEAEHSVTRDRIRQIEGRALRKLRHPARSKKLADYLRETRAQMLMRRDDYPTSGESIYVDTIKGLQDQIYHLRHEVDSLEERWRSTGQLEKRLEQLQRVTERVTDSAPISYLGLQTEKEQKLDAAGIQTIGSLAALPDYELSKIVGEEYANRIRRNFELYERAKSLGIAVSAEPTESLRLNVGTFNALVNAGVRRVWQVRAMKKEELMSIRRFGAVAYEDVRQRLPEWTPAG